MAEVENTGNSLDIQNDNGDVVDMIPTTPGMSSLNLYNEQSSIGNGVSGPNPTNDQSRIDDLFSQIALTSKSSSDPYAYAKPTSFNYTHTGLNFDRYYNHPNFKKLGFSPYRDNETIYNNNSSWFDDFKRASTQYGTLWGNGFSSLFKNWGSLASSTPDFEGAHTMEKAMAIGSSSKDGFGSSFTNFYLNSAYTVGVLYEIAAEEIALLAATAATATAAAPVAIGRSALNVGRFTKAIGNLFKGTKNISNARKVWNVAKKITPFGDTLDLARGIIAGDRATLRGVYQSQKSIDAFARSKALFGQFYRDAREINAASAESKLEAGMVSNQVSGDLINKFYAENGRMPNDAESKMIYGRAQRAGAEAFLYNMPAIYFSNKIVLETAFKGIKPLRNIIDNVPSRLRPITKVGPDGKKIVQALDLDNVKTYFTKDYLKNIGKGMSPKKILGSGLRYTSANIMEGAQEIYQESLSSGLVDHYTNQNWGNQRIGQAGLLNSLSIGAKELDKNNMVLETFLSGFLMAAPIGGVQTIAFKKAPKLVQRIAKPKEYKNQQDARQKAIKTLENTLTDLVNDPAKWANTFHHNMTRQDQLALDHLEAEQAGDVKAAKDTQEESMFLHMHTMLEHNMMGEFRDQMKDLLKLDDQALQEAFGGNQSTNNADVYNSDLRSRINKAITQSEKLEERYKKINDTFINRFDPKTEIADYRGFKQAKQLYLFNEHMFERTVDRAQSIFDNLAANEKISQLVAGNISSILDTRAGGQLDQLISQLKKEIETYEAGTEEDIKLAKEKKKQLEGLEEWKNAATAYEQAYDSMIMAGLDPEQAAQYVEEAKRFPKGSIVEYTNQQGNKIQGKIVSKSGNNIILEIINKAGRKQRIVVKKENAAVVGQLTLDFNEQDLEGQDMVNALDYLFQALFGKMEGMGTKGIDGPEGYLKILAGTSGLNMTREEMAVIFNGVMDYLRLKKDSMSHLNAINRLADPGFFANSAERISAAEKASKRIAGLKIKAMLADFEKIQDKHILLQELFELGVFLDPEDVDAFISDKKIPSSFYTATEVDGIPALTQINPFNENHQNLYKKIIDVLDAYETKEDVTFTNRKDINIIIQTGIGQLGQLFRKTTKDSRTIRELAKEYGFNINETSEVDVKELLQKIIDSDYGWAHDKVLARRLLATIPEGFTVKFNRNHGVGVSYDSVNGVVINPNFSAKNYTGGQIGLESLLLNGIMQKLVSDNLSNQEFKTAIEKIKSQVAEALANGQLDEIIAELKTKYEIDFIGPLGQVVVNNIAGMKSLEQFVAMAMTDPAFQSLLANVTVEETQKTLWEQFLDTVKLLVQQLTGMASGTSALEETINLTTAALTGSGITTTTEEVQVKTKPTVTTPLNKMPEELRTALQTAWGALLPEDKQSYNDISEWVKGSSAASGIISRYNKQQEQKEDDEQTQEDLKLAALTPQQLSYLRNKSGLNDNDIFAMGVNDLVEIADGKFRILNEGEVIAESQFNQGIVVKEFNGIKMTNAAKVDPKLLDDPIIAEKLTQVSIKLEEILANVLGRVNNNKVKLLNSVTKALAEQVIEQIKAIYNIKDLQFTEEMGSKIRLLLSDNSTFFFRVTTLKDIVDDMRSSEKEDIPQQLSEAIENMLKKESGTDKMKEGADRGLVMDEFFRLTLQGNLNAVIDDDLVTKAFNKAIENIEKTSGFNIAKTVILSDTAKKELRETLEHIISYMKENNLRALTSTNELFGNIGVLPVSGQVDIIMYNDKGELFILDMKTMSNSLDRAQMEGYGREVTGKTKNDSFGYAAKDTAQLNIYRELLQALVGAELQKEGMQIKGLGIIPLLIEKRINNKNELTIVSVKISDPIRKNSNGSRGLYIPVLEKTTVELFPELYAQAPPSQAPVSTEAKADIEKQKELENKVKELEKQRKALRSEDGSISADKMSEFKRLGEEINKAKEAASRGNSTNSALIKRFPEGADTSILDPEILSTENKKEAADIIEQVIQNSKSADEAFREIKRLGYIFDINVHQTLRKYLEDRFDPNAPRIGNNKDSFQAWIYGKTDAEQQSSEVKAKKADIEIEFEKGDYQKVLQLAKDTVAVKQKNTPENLQLLTKYPKLFQKYLSIEKRRQEELNKVEKEKNYSDKQLGKKDFYSALPTSDGAFLENSSTTSYKEGASMYVFEKIGNNRVKFKVDNSKEQSTKLGLQYPDKTLEPAGEAQNAYDSKASIITVTELGEAELQNDRWVITKPMKFYYGIPNNSSANQSQIDEINEEFDNEITALEGAAPSTPSVINQEIIDEYAGQVIYVSPGITIPEELANDPYVILYDDISVGILNQHLDELGVAEITRETLFATISEIYGSTNKAAKNKLTQLLNNDVYNAAINQLAENPEKILITQSKIFRTEAGSNVAVAIVPESIENYDNKALALAEQMQFRKNSRLRITKSNDLQKVLKDSLTKLAQQRELTARGESATYEEFVEQADLDSLILLLAEVNTMEDPDFVFKEKEKAKESGEKEYLRELIKTELKKRMKDGITNTQELLKVASEGNIVLMKKTDLYPEGLGVVTKSGKIKAVNINESKGDEDFKQYGKEPSEDNKVIGVEQLAEVLEEEETTEDENNQAAENNKTINLTISKDNKVNAVNNAQSVNEEADNVDFC